MTTATRTAAGGIAALRILVVEDEMLLMMLIEDALTDAGCALVKASRIAKAVELAETGAFDCAILDVNVAGEDSYPIAVILSRRNIPFVLSTGYARASLPAAFRDRPMLAKPFLPEDIKRAIEAAMAA